MQPEGIENEDIDTLAEILEHEILSHRKKCGVSLAMFILAFGSLVVALALVGVRLATVVSSPMAAESLGTQFALLQVIVPLAAVALSFFGTWWAATNCLNSIERTLCAARNRRLKLLQTFLGEMQCAGKSKQRAWLEIAKSAVM